MTRDGKRKLKNWRGIVSVCERERTEEENDEERRYERWWLNAVE